MSKFSHEKLNVYREGLKFITWLSDLDSKGKIKGNILNQLDRASNSVVLNIAEGNGKYTSADRCRFFDIAKGSAFECAAGLDILVAQGAVDKEEVLKGKEILLNIVNMLVGLIRTNSDRVYEPEEEYKKFDQD
ncbi:MAG: four helix bundle protein [Calditrichaeota bacterium]|nr:four helix bundle protein [Calditrichota bacterium]